MLLDSVMRKLVFVNNVLLHSDDVTHKVVLDSNLL